MFYNKVYNDIVFTDSDFPVVIYLRVRDIFMQ